MSKWSLSMMWILLHDSYSLFDYEVEGCYNISMVNEIEARVGTGGAPPKIGIFIRDFLREHGEASPAEVHRAYKRTFKGSKTTKKLPYRLGTYQSHTVYIQGLSVAGLVEKFSRDGDIADFRGEDSIVPRTTTIRLTDKGERAPGYVWEHPLRLYYRPFDWEYERYGGYIKAKE